MNLKFRLEFDGSICRWCRSCELVCSLLHEGACNPSLSRITIDMDQFDAGISSSFCRQCDKPECSSNCPVNGAMIVDSRTGAVSIVDDLCIGCGVCAEMCPHNAEKTVLKLNPSKNVYFKCDLCRGNPACVEICPTGALKLVEVRRN